MSSSASSSKTPVPDAVFFELSPNIILGVRIVNILTLLMIGMTFIMCLVRGGEVSSYYLLACNTIISGFVGIVVNWWYKSGDLGSEKFWYILLVAFVLIFQCITTDIFIFKVVTGNEAPTTTPTTSVHPVTNSTPTTTHNASKLLHPFNPQPWH